MVVLGLAVLGACSDGDAIGSTRTTRPPSTRPSSSTDASGTAAGAPTTTLPLEPGPVHLVDLGLDADAPIDVAFRPDSTSMLVAERGGRIREAVQDGDKYRFVDGDVIDLTRQVGSTDGERGLLGIAVAPDWTHLYASYTEAGHGDSRIDEYPLTDLDGTLQATRSGRRQLVAIRQPAANHNGGSLRFGADGKLFAGFGDGGDQGDPDGNGQRRDTLLGKVLRIDPSRPDGVPTDNPFVEDGARTDRGEPLIWATGLRNPWRLDVDPATGDLWIGDVGQDRYEEIDRLPAAEGAGRGANLGWDLYEGTSRFDEPNPAPGAAGAGPFVAPVLTYAHDHGCAVTGGVVVRDPSLPGLDGAFLYGDFCTPGIRAVRVAADGTAQRADLGVDVGSVVSFARGPAGEVTVVSLDGGIKRLTAA